MKYTNILGKDFKTKKDAKEYFNSVLYSIKQPTDSKYLIFTEDTIIKQSQIVFLYNNYLTTDEKILSTVFKGSRPYGWWCKIYREGLRNLAFEIETRQQKMIPISIPRVFTCFGAATTNDMLHEKKTARFLIQDQRTNFLKKFIKEKEFLKLVDGNVIDITNIYNQNYECENCELIFKYGDIEVHHSTRFNNIYDEWRENVWKEDPLPNSAGTYFRGFKILEDGSTLRASRSWEDFHYNTVKYKKLCKACHAKETYA